LRAQVRRRFGIRPRDVDDLLQEFLVSRILENNLIELADQKRGNFRVFLATALNRFLSNWLRAQAAAKRKAVRPVEYEGALLAEVSDTGTRDEFDYGWARQVLGQAIRRMRRECFKGERIDLWTIFKERTLLPSLRDVRPTSYGELVSRLNLESATRASNVLTTASRMFARALRHVLSLYQETEADIDSEIRDLWRAISKPRAGST